LTVPFSIRIISQGRSQCPRGLRHELSSLARTLESCAFIVFVLLCK
jgi:hypothetical protein